jgi:hypothetical protein
LHRYYATKYAHDGFRFALYFILFSFEKEGVELAAFTACSVGVAGYQPGPGLHPTAVLVVNAKTNRTAARIVRNSWLNNPMIGNFLIVV